MEKRGHPQFSLLSKVRWGPKSNMWNCGPDVAVVQEWSPLELHLRVLAVGSLEFGDFWEQRGWCLPFEWGTRKREVVWWRELAGEVGTDQCDMHRYGTLNLTCTINIFYNTLLGLDPGFLTLALLLFWTKWFFVVTGCPVSSRMFSVTPVSAH